MSQDDEYTGSDGKDGSRPDAGRSRSQGSGRLPPPAFPPGARRRETRHRIAKGREGLGDAFISPDDPMPTRSDVPEDAFIAPDTPIVRDDGDLDMRDIQVTGMGDDPHLDPFELTVSRDPYVRELVEQVSKLAEALKSLGEAGLRATPGMSRFEATLRAYCVGYLAGRRAEDEGK